MRLNIHEMKQAAQLVLDWHCYKLSAISCRPPAFWPETRKNIPCYTTLKVFLYISIFFYFYLVFLSIVQKFRSYKTVENVFTNTELTEYSSNLMNKTIDKRSHMCSLYTRPVTTKWPSHDYHVNITWLPLTFSICWVTEASDWWSSPCFRLMRSSSRARSYSSLCDVRSASWRCRSAIKNDIHYLSCYFVLK